MLEITAAAAEQLRDALTKSGEAESACIRIAMTAGGVELLIDEQREGDASLEHEEQVLVVMDPVAAQALDGRKIDFDEATSRFVFA